MSSPQTVLESCVSRSRKNMWQHSKLFNVPQFLEFRRVNKVPDSFFKANESMNVVEHFSLVLTLVLAKGSQFKLRVIVVDYHEFIFIK